jgi:hypothetical protein
MVTLTEESLVLQVGGWARGQPPSPGKIQLLKILNQRMPDGSMDKDQSELPLSRIEEDGRNWLRRPKLCTESCRAIIRRRQLRYKAVAD